MLRLSPFTVIPNWRYLPVHTPFPPPTRGGGGKAGITEEDRGEQGEQGERGEQGEQGEQGERRAGRRRVGRERRKGGTRRGDRKSGG